MKGEELEELNLDELKRLEKLVETGLSRVMAKKVLCSNLLHIYDLLISLGNR